jgi:hypothetical protein
MTLERRNPLPVGRYWIDIFESGMTAWQAWLTANAGTVRVETTQDFESPGIFAHALEHPLEIWAERPPARRFVIFAVSAPTPWSGTMGLGHPTVASPDVTQSDDTVQKPPPPPEVLDSLSEGVASVGAFAATAGKVAIGLGAIVAAYFVVKLVK